MLKSDGNKQTNGHMGEGFVGQFLFRLALSEVHINAQKLVRNISFLFPTSLYSPLAQSLSLSLSPFFFFPSA